MYDFDSVISRWQTDSEKYDGLQKFAPNAPAGSIPLWIADMDFRTAPEIIEAMQKRVAQGIFGYTDIYDDTYYKTVCGWMKRRHDWHLKPEEIIVDSGVVPAVFHGLTLTARRGDGVIIHTPAYTPFYDSIKKAGMVPVYSKLIRGQGRYEIDFDDFEEKAREKNNTVLILCSPHNPTGRVWTEQELTRLMGICKRHDITVISDEIHSDILRQGIKFVPLASLFPEDGRIITCTSPSKSFNLAGNHLANIMIRDSGLRERWEKQFHYLPNPVSVEAAKAAYEAGGDWLDALNRYLDNTFDKMDLYFRKNISKAEFCIPEATYLAWFSMGGYGLAHDDMVNLFLHNGLTIEGGDKFVENGRDHIRMNVAAPHSVIDIVLDKIKNIF